MFVTAAVLRALPMPLPNRLMTTASNPFKKPGVSNWAVVTRVTDGAPNSAVRLNGIPLPPPPWVVSPSNQTAKRGAAAPMEGTMRTTTTAHTATNLSRAITLLSLRRPCECGIFQPETRLQEVGLDRVALSSATYRTGQIDL